MRVELGWTDLAETLGGGGSDGGGGDRFFNPLAGLISLLSVTVLACGVQESKRVTNVFTVTKVILVLFMIVGGFCLFQPSNMTPLIPPALGATGVIRGATSSFFGYLGFDEVCCLASEAKNPSDMPKAVLWTLAIVTSIYVLASISLCGMQNYEHISDTSGFPAAFADRGVHWAAQLTAAGEVLTLPVVVLISLLAQPRLCAAMAKDGLLPAIFAKQNEKGTLFWSSILCGLPMTLLATFVPFSWMDDAISVGILFAFNMTNTALILMKCNKGVMVDLVRQESNYSDDEGEGIVSTDHQHVFHQQQRGRRSLSSNLLCYHVLALITGLTSHLSGNASTIWIVQIGAAICTLAYAFYLHRTFPKTGKFGDASYFQRHDSNTYLQRSYQRVKRQDETVASENDNDRGNEAPFEVPWVPFLPLFGIFLNWFLISELEWNGMLLLLVFLAIISSLYLSCINGNLKKPLPPDYCNPTLQRSQNYNPVHSNEAFDGPVLLREISLPKR
jgi:hypothetical protein